MSDEIQVIGSVRDSEAHTGVYAAQGDVMVGALRFSIEDATKLAALIQAACERAREQAAG